MTNTANRTIRPFRGLETIGKVFESTNMHFGPDACTANAQLYLELHPHEFLARPTSIRWTSEENAFRDFRESIRNGLQTAEVPMEAAKLIIVAKSSFLKLAEIVYQLPLTSIDELPWQLNLSSKNRPRALSTPFSGFSLQVAIILACDIPQESLRPSRKGTWLAQAVFGVDTRLSQVFFSPVPLTDEIRKSLKVGAKATRFVDLDGYDFQYSAAEQELPKFYVDEAVLAQLNARRSSGLGKVLQIQLAVDFVSAIIRKASETEQTGLTYDNVRHSILGSVVRMLSPSSANGAQLDANLSLILDNPSRAIADMEHVFNVTNVLLDALANDEESQ